MAYGFAKKSHIRSGPCEWRVSSIKLSNIKKVSSALKLVFCYLVLSQLCRVCTISRAEPCTGLMIYMYYKHGRPHETRDLLAISGITQHEVSNECEGRSWLIVRHGVPSAKDMVIG